jgi:succinate dehydrogenase / fumarate reductase cytochrome b subunit
MIAAFKMFYTSVGRKLLMAMTGLFLCIFLVEHLFGNLELYKMDGGKAFEEYTELLTGNLLIRIIEYVLFAGIIIHAVDGLMLTLQNKKARPVGYEVNKQSTNSTWFSRNMGLTGSIIFFFLVVHLRTFFFPHRFGFTTEPMAISVAEAFSNPWYVTLYIISMVVLCLHLNHGFQSAFQSMGWNNHKYARPLKYIGTTFALIMMIGFASFPIIFYFDLFGVSSNILSGAHGN